MSKKNNSATITYLRDVNRVLKKVKERKSKVKFEKIGNSEDLMVVGIGDASFKLDEKSVGKGLLFLTNVMMTRASPIYWKTKKTERVCHRS